MGDNRDNSVDSRATYGPGMVPIDHLIGRADLMMFSFKKCEKEPNFRCPPTRFLKAL
jgi:signal peptidase I